MDGIICNLKGVCDLADKYNALVMVDDSHAVGFVGKTGRGTASTVVWKAVWISLPEHWEKHLEEHPADIHPDGKRSLIC